MKTFFNEIKSSISKGNAKKAITSLMNLAEEDDHNHDILLINARYNNLESQVMEGIISQKDSTLEFNKINKDILNLLEKLPEAIQKMGSCQQFMSKQLDIPVEMVQEIYTNLTERYNTRMHQKLDNAVILPLTLTYSQEGTTQDFVETFFDEKSKSPTQVYQKCIDLVEIHNQLLILGGPGSGKTTLVLEMALDWMVNSSHSELPIIFNLASWDLSDKNFKNWMHDTLVNGYGFSGEIANFLLDKNLLLPIFDGLDEAGRSHDDTIMQSHMRKECLIVMDEYITESNIHRIVICSRKQEYLDTSHNAPITAQVMVNPFTTKLVIDQMATSFHDSSLTNKKMVVIKKLMALDVQENLELFKVLQTPFYFNILFDIDVFSRTSTNLKDLPHKKEKIERYLLDEFVSNKLNKMEFDSAKSINYFSWISRWLVKKDKVNFELADFQLNDLGSPRWMNLIGSILYFFLFIYGFFIILLIFTFTLEDIGWVTIFSGLIATFIGVIMGIKVRKLKTIDQQYLVKGRLLRLKTYWLIFSKSILGTLKHIIIFLAIGIPLLYVLEYVVEITGDNTLADEFDKAKRGNVAEKEIKTFSDFLLDPRTIIFYVLLFYHFYKNIFKYLFERREFEAIATPYQRLRSGWKFVNIKLASFLILLLLFFFVFTRQIQFALNETIDWIIIIVPFFYYFNSLVQHAIIRLGMYLEGLAPIRFVKFLNQAVDVNILEKDGGQWRYRHKLLQDYFKKTS